MNNVWNIAKYTFLEIYKSKIFVSTMIAGLIIIFLSWVISEISYGDTSVVALDIGFGLLSIEAILIAFFMGLNLVRNEVETRTLYLILSRPVDRWKYFVGRIFGTSLIILANVIILGLLTLFLFFSLGGELNWVSLWSIFFIYLEANLLLAMVVFISLISNRVITSISCLILFLAGHGIEGVKDMTFVKSRAVLSTFVDVYSKAFPNFSTLNIKDYAVYGIDKIPNSFFYSFSYGLFYFLIFLLLGIWVFNNKELE